jgi:hypothetical protein
MKRTYIERELKELSIGKTRIIAWETVTRWAEDVYEIGTWGKKQATYAETLDTLCTMRGVI